MTKIYTFAKGNDSNRSAAIVREFKTVKRPLKSKIGLVNQRSDMLGTTKTDCLLLQETTNCTTIAEQTVQSTQPWTSFFEELTTAEKYSCAERGNSLTSGSRALCAFCSLFPHILHQICSLFSPIPMSRGFTRYFFYIDI